MKTKLCLLFCDYFQEEVEQLFALESCPDVRVRFYQANCDKTKQAAEVLRFITEQTAGDESVIIFTGVCLSFALEKLAGFDFQIEYLDICFELLLPNEVLFQVLAEGAHLFTHGMLKRWPQANQSWGFDDQARQAFFAEGAAKLVLITSHCHSADKVTMAKIARQLDLPWEIMEISLEHLGQRVFQVVNRWRDRINPL